MERVPEPELMEGEASAAAYAGADFDAPNRLFCEALWGRFELPRGARVLDLGCGPADIPLRLIAARPDLRVDAVDGSAAMLAHAERAAERAGAGERITLHHASLPGLALPEQAFDAIISNSLLHHLHAPEGLWSEVLRLARPGAAVLVMDLSRPASRNAARALVDRYAADEPEPLRRDFEASLHAAFRPDEVQQQLASAGLSRLTVERVSDRHLLVSGRR
jgi:ubiquinone/menaquinone biosynthesis C-methylase UbiE